MNMTNARNPIAEDIFRRRYNGKGNVMTPRIYARRMIATGFLAVELSNGDGIFPNTEMWAVTVLLAADPKADMHELSQCFGSRAEAEAYIETLRDWRPEQAGQDVA